MNTHKTTSMRMVLASIGITSLLTVTAAGAQVAAGTTGIDASGSYKKEVQSCLKGLSQQDQATCLREANNARAEKSNRAPASTASNLNANATARCNVLTGEDKAACTARVLGYGSESGSVAGGGVMTKVETVVMPAGATSVVIEPKTANPVVLVPAPSR
ncbi:MAG: hypothetical protein HGA21_17345 [Burkholderiaceae bacterium]|nr:hypothetical protein [Burkholderiaceae bacterium]